MDIDEIKKLIKSSTAVLVLDEGEPSFVVIGYKMYKDLVSGRGEEKEVKINPLRDDINGVASNVARNTSFKGYNLHEQEIEILERLNKEILALKSQIDAEEKGLPGVGID